MTSTQAHHLARLAQAALPTMAQRLGELVRCESPSDSVPDLRACAQLLQPWLSAALRRPAEIVEVGGQPHLLSAAANPRVLLLGHFDTVWPLGSLEELPFTIDTVARGPGCFDMKAGIVQMITAIELLDDPAHVSVLLTSDEEVGSATSRVLIVEHARRAGAVLVCEPSADSAAVKIGRKGIANYRVEVRGRAAHAGLEPDLGINASVECARLVLEVNSLGSAETTVTPTVMSAGTTANTVPEAASFVVDARSWSTEDLIAVDTAMKALAPVTPGAQVIVTGGIERPPFEEALAHPLYEHAQQAAAELGLPALMGVRSGGGSDGNLTAAAGVPTLDGLGAVGGHPHSRDEFVEVESMPQQAALLATLLTRLRERNSRGTGGRRARPADPLP